MLALSTKDAASVKDLNLLRVFDALLQTGSVTEAADRLHLTAPATSRALARLRRETGNDIMVRAGRGLAPTPFATSAAGEVRSILDAVDQLLTGGAGEDPARWHRTIRIRLNDALVPTLAPALLARTQTEAPGLAMVFVPEGVQRARDLRVDAVDIDVGAGDLGDSDVRHESLAKDVFVAAVARQSLLGSASHMSIDDLCRNPHVVASRWGRSRGPLDDALDAIGRQRRVAVVVPSLSAAAMLALEGDGIALVPRLLALHLQQRGLPMVWHHLPLQLPVVDIAQHWHQRLDLDQPMIWLRHQIRAALAVVER